MFFRRVAVIEQNAIASPRDIALSLCFQALYYPKNLQFLGITH